MKKIFLHNATRWLIIALVVTTLLSIFFYWVDFKEKKWFPQVLVTLVGLTGASWFIGRRIDLLEEGNIQQRDAVVSRERANFNGAIKDAVEMMSEKKLSTAIAGQLWLHSLAAESNLREAPLLVQSLLSAHITNTEISEIESRQLALNLLFKPDDERYDDVPERANLSQTTWNEFDFLDLNLRGANVRLSDFTDVKGINGTCFNNCDLSETKWRIVGGHSVTLMRNAGLHGAETISGAKFKNVDFTQADFSNHDGLETHFSHTTFVNCEFKESDWTRAKFASCTFVRCKFHNAIWDGVTLEIPVFRYCEGITEEQARKLQKLTSPEGLPHEVMQVVRSKGIIEDIES